MYTPPAFREDRPEILHALIREARLALLVSNGAGGVPDVTHLPLTLDAGRGILIGHLARANPHWRALREAGRAVAVFRGAEGYVSPNWYPSKAENHRVVPTWNYEAVQAEGPVEIIEDPARLLVIVSELTREKEAAQPQPWAVADAPAEFVAAQLKGIVGFELRIERLTGKRKLSQNRNAADRAGAIAGLAGSEDARDRAVAAVMQAQAEGR
ncbi:FMN-binding negative transcriptional regulator [Siccirubricoccus sp. KC 17139]|uniref:FMN-binding negative transcriptional regulator n=1 Tax=Siccirubricoccus soli TaxID=2899147 RepID=A0ABT1D8H5_9PROT|nr:FMN-binding negative transcriptional regulator [Siccirubricoccus soli]MCO6418237.1 FMN-binding negative transcriptional regulator [Siccirubricoccus soli]MCP2684372.1 FMN-binding negative transcriptional regulator [Siccirubricoccus soli]